MKLEKNRDCCPDGWMTGSWIIREIIFKDRPTKIQLSGVLDGLKEDWICVFRKFYALLKACLLLFKRKYLSRVN